MRRAGKQFRFLLSNESGVAFVEFALMLPFLMLLFLGTIELSRYTLINQKLEKVVNTVGDVIAQSQTASTREMDKLLSAIPNIMQPYTFDTNGTVIISSVRQKDGTALVRWQYKGGGTLSRDSEIGATGEVANLPADLAMFDGEDAIITEVHYNFTPMLAADVLESRPLHKMAMFRPRLGALTTLVDDN